jgi:hypothetical protein
VVPVQQIPATGIPAVPEPAVPLNLRNRYATTVEDVPEEEQMPDVPPPNAENAGVPRAGNQSQNAERTCRICLSGAEDGNSLAPTLLFGIPAFSCTCFWATELIVGRLISPCRCRGTMKFVHLQCLNSWRYASPNRRSVYQCDQCGYKYHFNRTQYAAIASSIYTRVGSISPSQFMFLKHLLPWPAPTSQSDSPSPLISYIPSHFLDLLFLNLLSSLTYTRSSQQSQCSS